MYTGICNDNLRSNQSLFNTRFLSFFFLSSNFLSPACFFAVGPSEMASGDTFSENLKFDKIIIQ